VNTAKPPGKNRTEALLEEPHPHSHPLTPMPSASARRVIRLHFPKVDRLITKRLSRRERTAYHETGHTIASLFLELPLRSTSIVAKEDYLGVTICRRLTKQLVQAAEIRDLTPAQRDRSEREVVVSLAGVIAEKMACGRWKTSGAREDVRSADDFLGALSGSDDERTAYFTLLAIRTRDLLRRRWPYVEAVSKALLSKNTLAINEIWRVVATVSEALVPEKN
jgi:hypothetical protein